MGNRKAAASSNSAIANIGVACIILLFMCSAVAMAQTSCNTNGDSPTQANANSCVQYVRNLGSTQCCQTSSSGCTSMCVAGTASVDICGPQGQCTSCVNAGDQLNIILATCINNGRVSGTRVSSPFNFRIRRS